MLKYHIIPQRVTADQITMDQPTLNGGYLTYTRKFRKNWLDDATVGADVKPFDVACSNGIIHAVDMVIVPGAYEPPTFAGGDVSQDRVGGAVDDQAAKARFLADIDARQNGR